MRTSWVSFFRPSQVLLKDAGAVEESNFNFNCPLYRRMIANHFYFPSPFHVFTSLLSFVRFAIIIKQSQPRPRPPPTISSSI